MAGIKSEILPDKRLSQGRRRSEGDCPLTRRTSTGGSEMNAMNSNNFNFLEHSCNHSWSECHFSEHSWCEHEHSSSNYKSIFVSGVLA